FDQRFKARFDECSRSAAQHGLLSKEVGFRLFFECRLKYAGASATDTGSVCKCDFLRLPCVVLVYCIQRRDAETFIKRSAHEVSWTLWCNEEHVNVFRRDDLCKMDVEAVRKRKGASFLQVVANAFFVNFRLEFIRQ